MIFQRLLIEHAPRSIPIRRLIQARLSETRKALLKLSCAWAAANLLGLESAVGVELAVLEKSQAVPAASDELESAHSAGGEDLPAGISTATSDGGRLLTGVQGSVCPANAGNWLMSVEVLEIGIIG